MSERTYNVVCLDGCLFESMTKEQIIAAIAEATGNTPTSIDDAFITKIKEQNNEKSIKLWIGTQAQYNALVAAGTVANDTIYCTSDGDRLTLIEEQLQETSDTVDQLMCRFGVCNTNYFLAEKAVTLPEFELTAGAIIGVQFKYMNRANAPLSLNVNGTGAKTIKDCYTGNNAAKECIKGFDAVHLFQYDGENWVILNPNVSVAAFQIGDIKQSVNGNAGSDWLECDGSKIDKSEYSALANILSANWYNNAADSKTLGLNETLTGIIYDESNEKYIAVGYDSSYKAIIYSSTTGIKNLAKDTSIDVQMTLRDIIDSGEYYVACGGLTPNSNQILYCKSNATTPNWSAKQLTANSAMMWGIAYGIDNGKKCYVACGQESSKAVLYYGTSPLNDWTKVEVTNGTFYSIVRANDAWYAVGSDADGHPIIYTASSVSGTWTQLFTDSTQSITLKDIAIVYDSIIVCGMNETAGYIIASNDDFATHTVKEISGASFNGVTAFDYETVIVCGTDTDSDSKKVNVLYYSKTPTAADSWQRKAIATSTVNGTEVLNDVKEAEGNVIMIGVHDTVAVSYEIDTAVLPDLNDGTTNIKSFILAK